MLGSPTDLTVVLIADHLSHPETHLATEASLRHSADDLGVVVELIWMATATISDDSAHHLGGVDAMVVPPGPCASAAGVRAAIQVARTTGVPLLATCAGMQHLVIEFAQNVIGATDASHAELDPLGSDPWITPLEHSLAGTSNSVTLTPATLSSEVYPTSSASETYLSSYGINPERVADLAGAGLVVSGQHRGAPHIVELPGHPFFIGTLFVPQMQSEPARPHPLVTGLLAAAAQG